MIENTQIFVGTFKRKGIDNSSRVGSEPVLLPELRAGVERMKKIMGIFLALLIATSVAMFPGSAARESGVLILKNSDAWNSPGVENTLSSMGISYDVVNSSEFKALNSNALQKYQLVIIVSDQDQAFYNDIGDEMGKLENYVRNGGSLEVHAANWGWKGGIWTKPLPGGTRIVNSYSSSDLIVGTNQTLVSNYASHGYLVGFPAGAKIITIQNSSRKPSTVRYTLGKGKVFVTGLTLEFSVYRNKPRWKAFFEGIIRENMQPNKPADVKKPSAVITPNFLALNMIYYIRYIKSLEDYGRLHGKALEAGVDQEIINSSVFANQSASEHYAAAGRYGEVKANLVRFSIFSDLRKAALSQRKAVDILKEALGEN